MADVAPAAARLRQQMEEERQRRQALLAGVHDLRADASLAARDSRARLQQRLAAERKAREGRVLQVRQDVNALLGGGGNAHARAHASQGGNTVNPKPSAAASAATTTASPEAARHAFTPSCSRNLYAAEYPDPPPVEHARGVSVAEGGGAVARPKAVKASPAARDPPSGLTQRTGTGFTPIGAAEAAAVGSSCEGSAPAHPWPTSTASNSLVSRLHTLDPEGLEVDAFDHRHDDDYDDDHQHVYSPTPSAPPHPLPHTAMSGLLLASVPASGVGSLRSSRRSSEASPSLQCEEESMSLLQSRVSSVADCCGGAGGGVLRSSKGPLPLPPPAGAGDRDSCRTRSPPASEAAGAASHTQLHHLARDARPYLLDTSASSAGATPPAAARGPLPQYRMAGTPPRDALGASPQAAAGPPSIPSMLLYRLAGSPPRQQRQSRGASPSGAGDDVRSAAGSSAQGLSSASPGPEEQQQQQQHLIRHTAPPEHHPAGADARTTSESPDAEILRARALSLLSSRGGTLPKRRDSGGSTASAGVRGPAPAPSDADGHLDLHAATAGARVPRGYQGAAATAGAHADAANGVGNPWGERPCVPLVHNVDSEPTARGKDDDEFDGVPVPRSRPPTPTATTRTPSVGPSDANLTAAHLVTPVQGASEHQQRPRHACPRPSSSLGSVAERPQRRGGSLCGSETDAASGLVDMFQDAASTAIHDVPRANPSADGSIDGSVRGAAHVGSVDAAPHAAATAVAAALLSPGDDTPGRRGVVGLSRAGARGGGQPRSASAGDARLAQARAGRASASVTVKKSRVPPHAARDANANTASGSVGKEAAAGNASHRTLSAAEAQRRAQQRVITHRRSASAGGERVGAATTAATTTTMRAVPHTARHTRPASQQQARRGVPTTARTTGAPAARPPPRIGARAAAAPAGTPPRASPPQPGSGGARCAGGARPCPAGDPGAAMATVDLQPRARLDFSGGEWEAGGEGDGGGDALVTVRGRVVGDESMDGHAQGAQPPPAPGGDSRAALEKRRAAEAMAALQRARSAEQRRRDEAKQTLLEKTRNRLDRFWESKGVGATPGDRSRAQQEYEERRMRDIRSEQEKRAQAAELRAAYVASVKDAARQQYLDELASRRQQRSASQKRKPPLPYPPSNRHAAAPAGPVLRRSSRAAPRKVAAPPPQPQARQSQPPQPRALPTNAAPNISCSTIDSDVDRVTVNLFDSVLSDPASPSGLMGWDA